MLGYMLGFEDTKIHILQGRNITSKANWLEKMEVLRLLKETSNIESVCV